MQAQDRAYRIGQRDVVYVYRLLSKNSIDEVIYMRQLYKQQLYKLLHKKKLRRGKFEGVEGHQQLHGELFGVQNLFQYNTNSTQSLLQGLREKYGKKKKDNKEISGGNNDANRDAAGVCDSMATGDINRSDVSSATNTTSSSRTTCSGSPSKSRKASHLLSDLELLNSQDVSEALDQFMEDQGESAISTSTSTNVVGIDKELDEEEEEVGLQLLQKLGIATNVGIMHSSTTSLLYIGLIDYLFIICTFILGRLAKCDIGRRGGRERRSGQSGYAH
jgi:hypothetical protein